MTDFVYPRRCPLCDSLSAPNKGLVCDHCVPKIRFLDPECFSAPKGTEEEPIRRYRAVGHDYDDFAAAFEYKDEMRESVLRFKYSGRAEYADFFCAALWAFTKKQVNSWHADLIIPVPGDAGRMRERGYNQAELLARGISRLSGIPEDTGMVRRVRRTRPQSGLDPFERKLNLASAFACEKAPPERVIVVDDILTTGSTMDAMARCLKEAGAGAVFALCLCAD